MSTYHVKCSLVPTKITVEHGVATFEWVTKDLVQFTCCGYICSIIPGSYIMDRPNGVAFAFPVKAGVTADQFHIEVCP